MTERFARIPARAVGCRELTAADWRVLACITLHADIAGRAFPSMATIAAMTGIQRGNVPRSIGRLEQLGILRRERRARSTGDPDANLYVLDFGGRAVAMELAVLSSEDRVSSAMRTGGVLKSDAEVSSHVMTKQPIEQTHRACARDPRGEDKDASSEFETFWRIYPHRGEFSDPKKPAQRKFSAAVKRGVDPAEIIAGAERYRASIEASGTEGRFVAQAVTWLNQERWNDYREAPELPRLRVGMN
jgi:hypothetical protein